MSVGCSSVLIHFKLSVSNAFIYLILFVLVNYSKNTVFISLLKYLFFFYTFYWLFIVIFCIKYSLIITYSLIFFLTWKTPTPLMTTRYSPGSPPSPRTGVCVRTGVRVAAAGSPACPPGSGLWWSVGRRHRCSELTRLTVCPPEKERQTNHRAAEVKAPSAGYSPEHLRLVVCLRSSKVWLFSGPVRDSAGSSCNSRVGNSRPWGLVSCSF